MVEAAAEERGELVGRLVEGPLLREVDVLEGAPLRQSELELGAALRLHTYRLRNDRRLLFFGLRPLQLLHFNIENSRLSVRRKVNFWVR